MSLDIEALLCRLRENSEEKKRILDERELREVINSAKEILLEESNVQPVMSPVNICGDIHGQFFDLLELFRTGGELPHSRYIFIGDFVDRGYNSVETMEYLLCLKVKYPHAITLLRGNHESRNITMAYGFYDEICRKYGNAQPWKLFTDLFDCLPIGALVNDQIFCVHGGLSKHISTIDQIRTIERRMEIPMEGSYADLMWSDPDDVGTWAVNMRGAGWLFGEKVVHKFNEINGLSLICRAHQLVNDGHLFWFQEQLVTVWSAPNYCYRMRNKATILSLDEKLEICFKDFMEVAESAKAEPPKKVLPYFL